MSYPEMMLRSEIRCHARLIARAHLSGCPVADCNRAMHVITRWGAVRYPSIPSDLAHEWAGEIIAEEIELVHDAVESLCTDISRGWFRWAATNW